MKEEIENNKEDNTPASDISPVEEPPPSPKKSKSLEKLLFRGLIYLLVFTILLLTATGIILEHYFPAEQVRAFAEGQISKNLKLPLKIQKLQVSLFSGIQIEEIALGFSNNPVAHVKKVVLDYNLAQLLTGELVFNQVQIDHPQLTAISKNGVWNFQPLLDLKKTTPSTSSQDDSKTDDPPIFLPELNIKQMTINHASALLNQDEKLSAHLEGLNLEVEGKASLNALDLKLKVFLAPDSNKPEQPNFGYQANGDKSFQSRVSSNLNFSAGDQHHFSVSGVVGLQKNRAHMKASSLPSPDVVIEMDSEISLQPEALNLKKFWLSLDSNNQIKFSGTAVNFSHDPSFNLVIDEASFQLEKLLSWGQQWLPPLTGKGQLKARAVKISGQLPSFALKGLKVNGGTLSTKNLWMDYPNPAIKIEDMNADVKLQEVTLHDFKLKNTSADITFHTKKAVAENTEIENWNQSLSVTAKGVDDILWKFNTDMKSFHYDHPETKNIHLPVHATGSGNLIKNDINNLKLSYRLEPLADGTVSGTVKNFGQNSFKIFQNINLNLAEVVSRLPQKITTGWGKNIQGTAQAQTTITGKLNKGFSPIKLKGQAGFRLAGLTVNVQEPALKISNLNNKVSFPFEFHVEKGIQVPQVDIHADIESADAMNAWRVKMLTLDTNIAMKGLYNLKPNFGTLPIQLETKMTLGDLSNPKLALSLAGLTSDATLKTDLMPDDMRNTRVKGNVSFNNISATETIKTGKGHSQFSLDVHDKSLTRVHISQNTNIDKPSFQLNDRTLALESINLKTVSQQNLKNGAVNIKTFLLQSPNLVNARLNATLKDWGKSFDIDGHIDQLQLASISNSLANTFKPDLENIKAGGTISASLKAKGSLPGNKQKSTPQVSAGQQKPVWLPYLIPASGSTQASMEMEAEVRLNNGSLEDQKKNILANALNTKTKLTFKNGHGNLTGNFSGKVEGLGGVSLDPEFEFRYSLDNLNTLRIDQHQLKLARQGVTHSIAGHVNGLKPFLTGRHQIRINKLLNKLDIKLTNTNTIDITQAVTTTKSEELFGGLKAKGVIASEIKLQQSAGKVLGLDGNMQFNKFSLALPSGLKLNNLTGTFPFSKTFLLDPTQLKEKGLKFFPAQKKFFTPLRDFSHYKNIIRVESLEVQQHTLEDIGLDVVFKDNRLMTEKFIFDVLGGTVGGNLFLIQDRQGPVFKFSTEFAGIDASKLLDIPEQKEINAQVDGNLQVELKIRTGAEDQPVSLDQLSVKIAITRIGAQTLDRLLLFLDPEESKPAIMDTRAKLKLATPHRAQITLKNGNLNVEAWLKSPLLGIIKAPELKRVPVAGLKRFNTIHEQLQTLKDLEQISKYLSARGLQFKEENLTLHH